METSPIETAPAPPRAGPCDPDPCDLTVNGEPHRLPGAMTVAGLLDHLALDRRKVAVERNEEIVARSTYETTHLTPGDRIEIVHFIGGG